MTNNLPCHVRVVATGYKVFNDNFLMLFLMKNFNKQVIQFSVVAAATFLVGSCAETILEESNFSKEGTFSSLTEQTVRERFNQNSASDNADWLVNSATAQEQFDFWQIKLNHTLSNYSWTTSQKAVLNDLLENMSVDWFSSNSAEFSTFEQSWRVSAESVINMDDLYLISAYSGPYLSGNERNYQGILAGGWTLGGGGLHTDICGCSGTSDYCNSWLGTGYSKECTGECEVTSNTGCGTFLLYDCDGSCE